MSTGRFYSVFGRLAISYVLLVRRNVEHPKYEHRGSPHLI